MAGHASKTDVEEVLAPELRRGDIVVPDTLPAHEAAGVREAVEEAGATPLLLPPYSPDLDPIEPASAALNPDSSPGVGASGRRIGENPCGTKRCSPRWGGPDADRV